MAISQKRHTQIGNTKNTTPLTSFSHCSTLAQGKDDLLDASPCLEQAFIFNSNPKALLNLLSSP